MRFSRKKDQPGGWPPGGALLDREIPRPPLGPLPPFPARRGADGAGCFCAREGRLYAPSCRFHKGSGAGSGAENALSFFPDAESAGVRRPPFPRAGNSPRAPNAFAAPAEIQEAELAGGRSAIRWKAREAAAIVRLRLRSSAASGCSCACGARVTHAICKRLCRYIPTQPI